MIDLVSYGLLPDQFGELRTPSASERRPLVVLIHGGFWRDQYRLDLMHGLAKSLYGRGYASWNIEYRRVGQSGGGYPTTLEDVANAIDHLSADWPKHAVIGHSAGGHLALWNASRTTAAVRPTLTIGLAPVADVVKANRNGVGVDATTNFFGGDSDALPHRYNYGQPQPKDFAGRVVLLHGDKDESVPLDQSTELATSVDRVEVLTDTDHFHVIDPTHRTWEIVYEELDALAP